jgi:hypothetical protein
MANIVEILCTRVMKMENETIPVETIPGMGEEGIKENDQGDIQL